ncbi:DUF6630 family protein [Streptomyces sp. NPDC057682]|uniref:DUF6630 family protein n=1 Tax=Streptomyces sp. NPDC057682 TaxID=3346210 RepID=UPI0036C53205
MSAPDEARSSLAALAGLLAPGVPAVAAQVLRAYDHPEAYVREFADRLQDRGIEEPFAGLAWISLVDALAEYDLLAEFDWKEDAHEIRARLGSLASRPPVDPWVLIEDAEWGLLTADFLAACGRHYAEVGAALAVLDIESDCYPVVCLRAAQTDRLTALAAQAGCVAVPLGA